MIQRRAARFVMRDYSTYSSVTSMQNTLGWSTLEDRRKEHRLILMYQIVNDLVAIPTEDILHDTDSRTRSNHLLTFKHITAKTDAFKNSYFPKTIKEWNNLDSQVVISDTVDTFRERIKCSHKRT